MDVFEHITALQKKISRAYLIIDLSVSCPICTAFSAALLRRLTKILDENQPVVQAGSMQSYSTVDHIHALTIILENYKEYNLPLYFYDTGTNMV